MDRQRIRGKAQRAKGNIKEATGRAVGDKRTELQGKAEQAEGNIREGVGKAREEFKKSDSGPRHEDR
jgi:uncharacterized protein YjbJ (UPF0337 family)